MIGYLIFLFMFATTLICVIGVITMAVLIFRFANEVIRFKLLFYYFTKFNLSAKEKDFIKSYDSYFLFTYEYDDMLKDCSFFSIDKPKTVKEGIEIMIYLKEYDND